MRRSSIGVAVALLSASAIALSSPSLASAVPTADVVAGRERVKVTVFGVAAHPESCRVDPDANGVTKSLPLEPSGSMVAHGVAPGARTVRVWCPDGGIIYDGIVDVQRADLLRDIQDRLFAATGSADRVSDPTLR